MKSFFTLAALLLTTTIAQATALFHTGGYNTPEDYSLMIAHTDFVELEHTMKVAEEKTSSRSEIVRLEDKLAQQKRFYENRIAYLQNELKKSQTKVIENAITYQKREQKLKNELKEETKIYNVELLAKNQQILEYKAMMDKVAPNKGLKNLITANTELTLQLRDAHEKMAGAKLLDSVSKEKTEAIATKTFETPSQKGRLPASVK